MDLNDQTFAEINIANLLYNIRQLKKLLPRHVMFMAVVKADAYGHGAVAVSKAIEKEVDYLSVAKISEALELKAAGIKMPILILSETSPQNAKSVVENGFVQTVYTARFARALSAAAASLSKKARIHIKVDTGMGRIGAQPGEVAALLREISKLPNLKIEGVFTHLARAEGKDGFSDRQINIFRKAVSDIDTHGLILHCANSAGVLNHKESHFNMVRVGIAMYGLYPPGGSRNIVYLKPALEFKTKVVYLKKVPAGTPLSYGSTYRTKKATVIATLPVGYADGLPRALSNKGSVLIAGKRYPIVGRICMDLTLVDIGNTNVKIGDEVVLIGKQGRQEISVDEIAAQADTINYEIVCGIGKRVPRIYKK